MNTKRFHDEGTVPVTVRTPSLEGGVCDDLPRHRRECLASLFAMRDLGMSGVAGGRRAEPSSLEREARVTGSVAHRDSGGQRELRSRDRGHGDGWPRARTVALHDGLRITFSSADRLLEET